MSDLSRTHQDIVELKRRMIELFSSKDHLDVADGHQDRRILSNKIFQILDEIKAKRLEKYFNTEKDPYSEFTFDSVLENAIKNRLNTNVFKILILDFKVKPTPDHFGQIQVFQKDSKGEEFELLEEILAILEQGSKVSHQDEKKLDEGSKTIEAKKEQVQPKSPRKPRR